MLEFPKSHERLQLDRILNMYGVNGFMSPECVYFEELNFDRVTVQKRMNAIAEKTVKKYEDFGKDLELDSFVLCRDYSADIVEDNIPLTFFTAITLLGNGDKKISFQLLRGNMAGGSQDDLFSGWCTAFSNGDYIGSLEFTDKGNLFNLIDRKTNPQFRMQGIASMLLEASEIFLQDNATARQKTLTSFADVSQMDVICWLYNNGYRPQLGEDNKKLGEILNKSDDISVGHRFCVFKNVPENLQVKSSDVGIVPNWDKAYKISLIKEIMPKAHPDVVDMQKETADAIIGNV